MTLHTFPQDDATGVSQGDAPYADAANLAALAHGLTDYHTFEFTYASGTVDISTGQAYISATDVSTRDPTDAGRDSETHPQVTWPAVTIPVVSDATESVAVADGESVWLDAGLESGAASFTTTEPTGPALELASVASGELTPTNTLADLEVGDIAAQSGSVASAPTEETDLARKTEVDTVQTDVDGKADDPHALGGESHSSDTLANLNGQIDDATLDDSSETRPPGDHDNSAHLGDYVETLEEAREANNTLAGDVDADGNTIQNASVTDTDGNQLEELVTLRGDYADRPATGDYPDQLFHALDRKILYRWDDTDGSWEAISGLGTATNPVPGESHFESLAVERRYTEQLRATASLSGGQTITGSGLTQIELNDVVDHQVPDDFDIDTTNNKIVATADNMVTVSGMVGFDNTTNIEGEESTVVIQLNGSIVSGNSVTAFPYARVGLPSRTIPVTDGDELTLHVTVRGISDSTSYDVRANMNRTILEVTIE